MSDSNHTTILRRMTGRTAGDAAETPLTLSRAVSLALTKSANDTVGLVLTVTSMAEDLQVLDDLLAGFDDNLMLISLMRNGDLAGIMTLDMQFRAAVLEMQTMGQLIPLAADERAATGTDKSMCDPVLAAFLNAMPSAIFGTELDGWLDGVQLGARIDSRRAAGLILKDIEYRLVRLSVDLGIAERTGQLVVALPLVTKSIHTDVDAAPAPAPMADWPTLFRAAVADAPGELNAMLHRFKMPLAQAKGLQAGQLVPLLGCTVNSVRLMSPDGKKIADAKLGQLGGMRAVRIEAAPLPQMRDLTQASHAELPDMMAGLAAGEPDGAMLGDAEPAEVEFDAAGALDLPLDGAPAFEEAGSTDSTDENLLDLDNPQETDLDEALDMAAMNMDALSVTD